MASEKSRSDQGGLLEIVKIVVQALILAMIVRTLLFQPFNIPTGSMKDTLLVGDYLFVSKFSYGYSRYSLPLSPDLFGGRIMGFWGAPPERGDIAVFRPPFDTNTDFIKRVIGLPGDRIQMKEGALHINGVAVRREKLPDIARVESGRQQIFGRWKETLPNGVSYETLDAGNTTYDNTREFVVPAGHYFMMGDNRDNSNDSRAEVGFVPLENFVGRAEIIFFSVDENHRVWEFWAWPWSLRFERIFKLI